MTSDSSKNLGGRPRKEGSTLQAKSANWRLVIPHLQVYKDSSPEELMNLKYQTLELLKQHQKKYSLRYHHIALEHHQSGIPHLDILLIYDKSVRHKFTHFDYLVKHGNLSTYRKLNEAILNYGKKQDKDALSNLPEQNQSLLNLQQLKRDPYSYLYDRMKQDPLHFNLQQYVQKHQLSKHISGWSSIKTKLKDMQVAAANLSLKDKPGFKYIDRNLIESCLNSDELRTFDSWSGYQTIVNYLNQIVVHRGARQQKQLNLLITGHPNCGKSALIWQRDPLPGRTSLLQSCSIYPIGMSQWFPKYQSDVYHCIYWNQAKLTSYSYDTVLKLLDGSPLDLPCKGSVSRKVDNPLIVMTSNLTLQQMIVQKFGYNKSYVQMAKKNLAVRVQNVIIPEDYNLFLLQKLLVQ